jgi:hypothetical protein
MFFKKNVIANSFLLMLYSSVGFATIILIFSLLNTVISNDWNTFFVGIKEKTFIVLGVGLMFGICPALINFIVMVNEPD